MELIDNFNASLWQKGDANVQEGFLAMRIASRAPVDAKKGQYKYAVFDDNGDLKQVYLEGAVDVDPLRDVLNCSFKLDDKKVVGVILENECVILSEYNNSSSSEC